MKFEYKKEYFAIQYEMAGVNEMGESGWELCSINDGAFYFKRAVEVKNLAQPDVSGQRELLASAGYEYAFSTKGIDENGVPYIDERFTLANSH